MLRKCTDEDISYEKLEKVIKHFYNNYQDINPPTRYYFKS